MAAGAPARLTALTAAVVNVAVTVWLLVKFQYADGARFQFEATRMILGEPRLGFNVGLDGMALIMVLLTSLVTLAAVMMRPVKAGGEALYYSSSLLIAAGAMGAFVATDLFFFYAFHELALIPTFLMIGMRGTGDNKDAAWKITVYLGLGSLVLLAGLAALVIHAGAAGGGITTFDMAQLRELAPKIPASVQEPIYLTLLLGFGILISLFPFHSWAAPAYASAPAPTAMLHAGVLKKFGLYGLLRVATPMLPAGAHAEWIQHLLLVLLLGNILYIGLVTIAQRELDLLLGNSSVMHMGYVFLGIASGTAIGFSGAVLLMFAHGVSIALLFALCSVVREKTGTLQMSRLGGLAKSAPFLGLVFAMASFASIGLPGFTNFSAELLVFLGGFATKPASGLGAVQIATILALWGVVISAVYMLRAFRRIFKGEPSEATLGATDLAFRGRLPVLLLLAALLVTGFVPNLLMQAVAPFAEALAKAIVIAP
ncbi:MAG: proton-translocating NADH-quinone oxidoreductase, chain [Verrucomicrobiales bacterium]|nr:proton-translocating NADH-quinone oxidoreductase, chain [Verrucomicrobiales bacterium]